MEKIEKKLTEMNKEELKFTSEEIAKKIETGKNDIQKCLKRINNIKKMIKEKEKDQELIQALLKNFEYEELLNSTTNTTENQN